MLIVRGEDFTCARTVSDKLAGEEKITVRFNTEIMEASGQGMVSKAVFRDTRTGEEWAFRADGEDGFGIFVFAGYVPNTAWISSSVKRDEQGYLLTDMDQKTNVDGVYAAGDACVKNLRQVVTAVSDGAVAATSLERHVSRLHDKLDIPEFARKAPMAERSRGDSGEIADPDGEAGGSEFIKRGSGTAPESHREGCEY